MFVCAIMSCILIVSSYETGWSWAFSGMPYGPTGGTEHHSRHNPVQTFPFNNQFRCKRRTLCFEIWPTTLRNSTITSKGLSLECTHVAVVSKYDLIRRWCRSTTALTMRIS